MAAIQRPVLPIPIRSLPRLRGARLALLAVVSLVVALAVLQVQQYSSVTRTGYEIDSLKREQLSRQAENHDLEAEVARLDSLARVDIEARTRLHMEPAKKILYITVNQAVPPEQSLPSRFTPPTPDPTRAPTKQHSLFDRLFGALP